MAIVTMKQLLEAGVHFGHQTRRWNPKMKKYIFTERNGIYIIDLQKTVKLMDVTYNYVRDLVARGGNIVLAQVKRICCGYLQADIANESAKFFVAGHKVRFAVDLHQDAWTNTLRKPVCWSNPLFATRM